MASGIWLAEGGEDARGKDPACVIGRGSGGVVVRVWVRSEVIGVESEGRPWVERGKRVRNEKRENGQLEKREWTKEKQKREEKK